MIVIKTCRVYAQKNMSIYSEKVCRGTLYDIKVGVLFSQWKNITLI